MDKIKVDRVTRVGPPGKTKKVAGPKLVQEKDQENFDSGGNVNFQGAWADRKRENSNGGRKERVDTQSQGGEGCFKNLVESRWTALKEGAKLG